MRNGKDNRRKGGEEEQISKALSHVLRHSAVDEHLSI
jgi:RNA:NAD 2'-phosphotransferase (TPT1/KptA family)